MKKLLIIPICLILAIFYAATVNADLSDNMVRFHVIANSNSAKDQSLKLKVRDGVLEKCRDLTKDAVNKSDAEKILLENSENLRLCAESIVRREGYDYKVLAEYGNTFFPRKEYGKITLPSGKYDAMRIKIGKAEGENWWCVMFPPVCITEDCTALIDEEALSYLKKHLSKEEYNLITNDSSAVVFRLRIVDEIMKFFEKIGI